MNNENETKSLILKQSSEKLKNINNDIRLIDKLTQKLMTTKTVEMQSCEGVMEQHRDYRQHFDEIPLRREGESFFEVLVYITKKLHLNNYNFEIFYF